MRKIMLTPEVLSYLKLPPEKMLLEKGATLIAQWCQPELIIEWEVDVAPQLDNIAERVCRIFVNTNLCNLVLMSILLWILIVLY